MENLFSYTSVQFDIVRHILTLGVGAQVAGLVYFMATSKESSPKYRLSSTLSAVVMVSAALILLNQQISWTQAFTWDGDRWNPSNSTFSNGHRYVNWPIDVPMLTQLATKRSAIEGYAPAIAATTSAAFETIKPQSDGHGQFTQQSKPVY